MNVAWILLLVGIILSKMEMGMKLNGINGKVFLSLYFLSLDNIEEWHTESPLMIHKILKILTLMEAAVTCPQGVYKGNIKTVTDYQSDQDQTETKCISYDN